LLFEILFPVDGQVEGYLETFAVAAWEIWKIRNNKIFRGDPPAFTT
jgi:hypothetical protein